MVHLEQEVIIGTATENVSGGGGGLFGGASNSNFSGGGGGGSGYIGNSLLTNKKMVMYVVNRTEDTKNYVSNDTNTKTETTQNVSSTPTSNYAKSGNGYARITILSISN